MVGEDGDAPGWEKRVARPLVLLEDLVSDGGVIKADSKNAFTVLSFPLCDAQHVLSICGGDGIEGREEVKTLVSRIRGGILGHTYHYDSLASGTFLISRDKV